MQYIKHMYSEAFIGILVGDGVLSYFPALHLWVGLDSPADFAKEPSTVISSELHSWVGIAICWIFPPTTASRCVSAICDYMNALRSIRELRYCKTIKSGYGGCELIECFVTSL